MSASLIKAGFKTMLEGSSFAGDLKAIYTNYPRLQAIGNMPAVIIWDLGFVESRRMPDGAAMNVLVRDWKIGLHLFTKIVNTETDGEAFDDLLDNIITLIQSHSNVTINLNADTSTTKILVSGEAMEVAKQAPDWKSSSIEYHAAVVVDVRELVNA